MDILNRTYKTFIQFPNTLALVIPLMSGYSSTPSSPVWALAVNLNQNK